MNYCCEALRAQVNHACSEHPDPADCPDALIVEPGSEFGIRVHDGWSSFVTIRFCPWCGADLSRLIQEDGGVAPTTPNESAAAHFRRMTMLTERLKAVPAECREHSYSYDAFGSWSATLRCDGVRIRVTADGREGSIVVERAASRHPPYT